MRAVDIKNDVGNADALFINEDMQIPPMKTGDLRVKVKAFGLNRMDLMQREGHYPLPPQAPKTLGVEFSGIVDDLTEGITDFKKGDEVFGLAYGGAYAEYIAVSSKMCIHKPSNLSWEEAAGMPEVWITATQALWIVGQFKPGDRVLIHSGASGIGIAAIQLALAHGASAVYTTVGSDDKIDFCKTQLGTTGAYNYKTQDFSQEILAATEQKGVDVIVDAVGQSHFAKNMAVAARDARWVLLAFMSGPVVEKVDLRPILFKRLHIEGTTLRSRDLEYQRLLRDKVVQEALPGITEGKLKIHIEKTMSWTKIAEAHKLMESNQTQGKIICVVD